MIVSQDNGGGFSSVYSSTPFVSTTADPVERTISVILDATIPNSEFRIQIVVAAGSLTAKTGTSISIHKLVA